jgi:hypothetical protein
LRGRQTSSKISVVTALKSNRRSTFPCRGAESREKDEYAETVLRRQRQGRPGSRQRMVCRSVRSSRTWTEAPDRRRTEVGDPPRRRQTPSPLGQPNGATISVLIEGCLRVTFHVDGAREEVTLRTKGDYAIFGPEVVHSWEAVGDTIVVSVRFPSVEVGSRAGAD